MSISITYNTSTETNVTQEFSTASELKSFISTNKSNFTGVMKVICDNSITDCSTMFENCINITNLDLSNFDTSQVTNMNSMFDSCSSLTSLDVSNFNTSNVTNMNAMFYSCSSLTSLDVSNFNTSNVTNMGYMFYNCRSLTSLDVSNFNTSNVTNMSDMFDSCRSLPSLDVNGFDMGKVERTNDMFRYCSNLETIYCEQDWKSNQITNSSDMFANCTKLKGAIPYDSAKIDINYANPDTGYFSYLPLPPAIPFLANLDIRQNQIKNAVIDKLGQEPSSPVVGQTYYNTTDNKVYTYNGTTWDMLTNESEILYIPNKDTYTTDDYNEYYPKVISAIQNHNTIFLIYETLQKTNLALLTDYSYSHGEGMDGLNLRFYGINEVEGEVHFVRVDIFFNETNNTMTSEYFLTSLVQAIEGKGLSTNDYTNEDKSKLDGLENYTLPIASATTLGGIKIGNNLSINGDGVLSAANSVTDYAELSNKPKINGVELSGDKSSSDLGLVAAEANKGLSTNDYTNEDKQAVQNNTTARHTHSNKDILDAITASYTTEEKNKLAGIEAGAQVNAVKSVNSKTGDVVLTATDVGALPNTVKVPEKRTQLLGDGSATSFTISSETEVVSCYVIKVENEAQVFPLIKIGNTQITIEFNKAPTTGQYKAIYIVKGA